MDGTLGFILSSLLLFTVWNNVVNMLNLKSLKVSISIYFSFKLCMLLILRTRKILEMNSCYFLIVSSTKGTNWVLFNSLPRRSIITSSCFCTDVFCFNYCWRNVYFVFLYVLCLFVCIDLCCHTIYQCVLWNLKMYIMRSYVFDSVNKYTWTTRRGNADISTDKRGGGCV